jgi:four helix bundle protein
MGDRRVRQPQDIRERTFAFAVRIVKLCQFLSKRPEINKRVVTQLLCAGTSVGANTEEAGAADSRKHFISVRSIALRECRESVYWLRLLVATAMVKPTLVEDLIDEATQIVKILASANVTAKRRTALNPGND